MRREPAPDPWRRHRPAKKTPGAFLAPNPFGRPPGDHTFLRVARHPLGIDKHSSSTSHNRTSRPLHASVPPLTIAQQLNSWKILCLSGSTTARCGLVGRSTLPGSRRDPIQHMVPHGVTLCDERMIEILGKRQADLFHHAARPRIRRYRKRDDLFEFQAFKTVSQHRSRAFGPKPSTPEFVTRKRECHKRQYGPDGV